MEGDLDAEDNIGDKAEVAFSKQRKRAIEEKTKTQLKDKEVEDSIHSEDEAITSEKV